MITNDSKVYLDNLNKLVDNTYHHSIGKKNY